MFQWQRRCFECLCVFCKTNTYFCVVRNVRLIELLSPLWSPSSIHIRLIFSSLCSLSSIHQTVCPCKFLHYEFIRHSWRQNGANCFMQRVECHLITTGQISRKTFWVTALNWTFYTVFTMKDVCECVYLFGKRLFLSPACDLWFSDVIHWNRCPHVCVGVSQAALMSLIKEFMIQWSSYVDIVFLFKFK